LLWVSLATVAALLLTIAVVRTTRTLTAAMSARVLAPLADDLLAVSTGEDPTGEAAARLIDVPRRHRATVERAIVARLEFLRGTTARALTDILEAWGVRSRWAERCRSPWAQRRAVAVSDVGLLHDEALIDVVIPLLRDRSRTVRNSAVRAIGRLQSARGAAMVLDACATDSRSHLPLWVAMEGLAFPGAEAAVAEAIAHPCSRVRTAAAHAVTLWGWTSTATPIRHALTLEPEADTRVHQVRALGVVGSGTDIELLMEMSSPQSPRGVRVAAIGALAEVCGDPETFSTQLTDNDAIVSRAAARAYGRHRSTPGVQPTVPAGASMAAIQELALSRLRAPAVRLPLTEGGR